MTGPPKRKGDRAELEVQAILQDQLGFPARRKLGAGRKDDQGDIDGVPDCVIQVANLSRISEGVREKPEEAERQRIKAGVPYAATFLRLRGGDYRVVMTVDQWAAMFRETL